MLTQPIISQISQKKIKKNLLKYPHYNIKTTIFIKKFLHQLKNQLL